MTTRTDTTAAIATLLRAAERANAPAELTAHLWAIRGHDQAKQMRELAELREDLADAHRQAEDRQPLADVLPLFGRAR